jgi:hypothetical protein
MNEIVKKKSFLKYIIAGIFILILISIALLIYVLIRKKGVTGVTGITYISQNNTTAKCPYPLGLSTSDGNEDAVKATCDIDPSCVGYYTNGANPTTWSIATKTDPSKCTDWQGNFGDYPVYKSKASGYLTSGNTNQKYGCPYTVGLSTSDHNEDAVKATCDLDPSCAGYYTRSDHGWSIATKTDPSKCDEKTGVPDYTIFYKKNPPPPPPKVGTYTEISNSAPSKRSYACFDSETVNKTEDVQRVLCDNDDDCKGYYFNRSVPGSMVYTIDKKCTDKTQTQKIDGYNRIKLKDNNYAPFDNPKLYGSMSCTKNFYAARLSEPGAEDIIKKICNELPTCKGYYKNKNAFIASKKLPSEIDSGDESDASGVCFDYYDEDSDYETEYPYFMKKEV